MATSELARPGTIVRDAVPAVAAFCDEFVRTHVLAALASLRLTVVLFALSIFLIFVGTLAQKDHDVWYVVNDAYFRVWFAWVEFLTFERLVQIFFKSVEWNLSGGFYFPGGKLIGMAAAGESGGRACGAVQDRRRRAAACGRLRRHRRRAGDHLARHSKRHERRRRERALARFLQSAVAVLPRHPGRVDDWRWRMWCCSWAIACARSNGGMLLVTTVLLAVLTVWLLANPDARLDDSGLRILWQLIKGTAAGIVLLVGCVMVFRKRAGIVLLHGGIALMMISELLTGIQAKESRMSIPEGGTVSYSDDIRTTELAVIDRSHAGPRSRHRRARVAAHGKRGRAARPSNMPICRSTSRCIAGCRIRDLREPEAERNESGHGRLRPATGRRVEAPRPPASARMPKASIFPPPTSSCFPRRSGESLGTYPDASAALIDQPVEVDGQHVRSRAAVQADLSSVFAHAERFRLRSLHGHEHARRTIPRWSC